jgi:type III pantothenate kinase
MTGRLVADVGNTRIKWGLVLPGEIRVAVAPSDDPAVWARQLRDWSVDDPAEWAVAGVHPKHVDQLVTWLRERKSAVHVIADYRELPLRINVDAPEKVGIDRLLNAVAAVARVPLGSPTVIIDAGSAVTVDLVDETSTFRGGSIFPGLRLMAQALHQFTAKLPLVERFEARDLPGRDTEAAIQAGIYHAVCGGIDRLVEKMVAGRDGVRLFFAGGSAELVSGLRCRPEVVGPTLTLDGIRRTAWPES